MIRRVLCPFGGAARALLAVPRCEGGYDADDERFQRGRGRTEDPEIDFDGGPVCCVHAVPGRVFRVVAEDDEGIEAEDGYYAYACTFVSRNDGQEGSGEERTTIRW